VELLKLRFHPANRNKQLPTATNRAELVIKKLLLDIFANHQWSLAHGGGTFFKDKTTFPEDGYTMLHRRTIPELGDDEWGMSVYLNSWENVT
jgi:hypothetical protein